MEMPTLDLSSGDLDFPMGNFLDELPLPSDATLAPDDEVHAAAQSSSGKREPADFVQWTWAMLNAGHEEIGWSEDGTHIVVRNAERLAVNVLPTYFRHSQYASFVRALNAYNFRKMGSGRWHNPSFRRDRADLLPTIRRKPQARALDAKNRSGGGGDGGAGGSTSLVRAPKRSLAMTTVSDEEHRQLWLMQKNVSRLETELEQMRAEDFQQRYDAVRLFQMLLKSPPPTAAPRSQQTPPILLQPHLLRRYASQNPRFRMLTSCSDIWFSASNSTDPTAAHAATHADAMPPHERVVDADSVSSGDGASLLPLPPSRTSSIGSFNLEKLDVPSVSAASSFDIPSLGLDLSGANESAARSPSPSSSPLWQHAHASTCQGGLSASAEGSISGGGGANAGCASGMQAHGCGPSDGLELLASMPMLPPSTSQLPPPGTLQRQQLETAVEWYFQQLTISSERLIPAHATAS